MPRKPQGASKNKSKKKTALKAAVREKYARKVKQVRVAITAVMACQVGQLIKGRPDKALLKKHLDAIDVHRQKYKARLKKEPDVTAHKAKITEAKGEHEATLLMIQEYVKAKGQKEDFHILWGFTAGTGIDQLWWTGDPPDHYIVVEAKGPGATLSTNAAKGDQMSKMWVRSSLESVMNSPKSSSDEIKHAKRMLKAMDVGPPPYVYGRVIEAQEGGGAKEVGCPDKGIYHKTK